MIKRRGEPVEIDGNPMRARVLETQEIFEEDAGRTYEPILFVEDDPRIRVGRSIIVRGHNLRIGMMERMPSGIKIQTETVHID